MIEQRSTDFENNYLFTGHELDRETNLYYAHARYLNPRLGVWLSVDPLADKYPNASPYNYCLNNPINMVDPDGMDPWPSSIVNAIRSEIGYNAIKRSVSVWLPESVVWGNDCIRTFNQITRNVLFNNNQKVGSQIIGKNSTHSYLKENDRASSLKMFSFNDVSGKKSRDNSTATKLSSSIGDYIKKSFDGKADEVNVFGLSVMDGYHSMMVTYGKDKNGNDVFNLFDQGPATDLIDGNTTFKSAAEFDNAINNYVKDRQDKKTKGGYQYPASAELFKIEADDKQK